MGILALACYKPKPGRDADLLACVRDHLPILRSQGLVTNRQSIAGRAADGTIVEMFEWESEAAVAEAHRNPTVRELWARYDQCCEYVAPSAVPGFHEPFPNFQPVDL